MTVFETDKFVKMLTLLREQNALKKSYLDRQLSRICPWGLQKFVVISLLPQWLRFHRALQVE